MKINDMVNASHENAVAHGWWEPRTETVDPSWETDGYRVQIPRSFGEVIALIHSEASEALEAFRDGQAPAEFHYQFRSSPETPLRAVASVGGKSYVYDGDDESPGLSDCEGSMDEGWVQLTPENAAKYGYDCKPVGVPSEMADIVIRVADACGFYGIDLEKAIAEKMEYNLSRPYLHGRVR